MIIHCNRVANVQCTYDSAPGVKRRNTCASERASVVAFVDAQRGLDGSNGGVACDVRGFPRNRLRRRARTRFLLGMGGHGQLDSMLVLLTLFTIQHYVIELASAVYRS